MFSDSQSPLDFEFKPSGEPLDVAKRSHLINNILSTSLNLYFSLGNQKVSLTDIEISLSGEEDGPIGEGVDLSNAEVGGFRLALRHLIAPQYLLRLRL